MDIDTALATVGGCRRWHILMLILLGFSMFFPLAWQGLSIVFIGEFCLLLEFFLTKKSRILAAA